MSTKDILYLVCLFLPNICVIIICFIIDKQSQNDNYDEYDDEQITKLTTTDTLSTYQISIINFSIIKEEYENLFFNYKFTLYQVSDYEFVYKIDNKLIVYLGIPNRFSNQEKIVIEELNYNDLFKINVTKFRNRTKCPYGCLEYIRYMGNNIFLDENSVLSERQRIAKLFPQLGLEEWYDNWKGVCYNFVIIKAENESEVAFATFCTEKASPIQAIRTYCEMPLWGLHFKYYIQDDKYKNLVTNFYENAPLKDRENKQFFFYYFEKRYIKETTKILEYLKTFLDEISSKNIEYTPYIRTEKVWKNEHLVYELCSKIYGKSVIYQYSPTFLKTDKGQLSYDIYIPKKTPQ